MADGARGQPAGSGLSDPKRLDVDSQLQLELDVAAEYRIPHSVFLSWDADDRDKAIWHFVRRQERCPDCGTREAEWDPKQGGRIDAYQARDRVCRGCAELARGHAWMTEGPVKPPRGMHIYLQRTREESADGTP